MTSLDALGPELRALVRLHGEPFARYLEGAPVRLGAPPHGYEAMLFNERGRWIPSTEDRFVFVANQFLLARAARLDVLLRDGYPTRLARLARSEDKTIAEWIEDQIDEGVRLAEARLAETVAPAAWDDETIMRSESGFELTDEVWFAPWQKEEG